MKNIASAFILAVLTIANAHSADEKKYEDPYAKFARESVEKQKERQDKLFEKSGVPKPSRETRDSDSSKSGDDKVCWGKNGPDSVAVCR
jgi:hypothetical protein